ncbi:MAG: aminotransferase class I/II-fold pyridoxal phosphate-dependent enzyme, partial [Pseudomonadota bacterium]
MTRNFIEHLAQELDTLRHSGLYKTERVISSTQSGAITLDSGRHVINLCANNYLGLSDHTQLVDAARQALSRYGYGMSSVRFICGTQSPHKALETRLSEFLGTEDT